MHISWKSVALRFGLVVPPILVVYGWKQFSAETAGGASTNDALKHVALMDGSLILALAISALFGCGLWLLASRRLKRIAPRD
jgi:hypothetical protein